MLILALTLAEVEHIAELAKLALTDEEKERYREQLSAILDYAAVLQQVDTSAIPATTAILPLRNVMRDDTVHSSLSVKEALANAPDREGDFFRVRAVLE